MTLAKPLETSLKSNFLYTASYYVDNLNIVLKEALPNNWDCLAIFHGFEGTGKSTLMFQTAHYLDPNFSLENVVFTGEQFNKRIDEAPEGSCIVWDEAITGANAEAHAKKINQAIISKLTQIRKKRLILLLGFPYLYMLSKYFVSRCLFSCYVYAKGFTDRGYFNFYDFQQTNTLYWYMKQVFPYFPMNAVKVIHKNFAGSFSSKMPIDENEYNIKKESARVENEDKSDKQKRAERVKRAKQLNHITNKDLAYIEDVSIKTISTDINEDKNNNIV